MVIFEVIDDRRFRAVMNKLGTLVEKGGVILICLDHKIVAAPVGRRGQSWWGSRRSKPRLKSACSRIQASMLAVLVLPWVPETASTHRF